MTHQTAAPGSVSGPEPPSGAQFEMCRGDLRAVVVEVGGALRCFEVASRPVFDGYDIGERCSGARGQTLIPWPNRLRDGRYRFDGAEHQLPLSEPAKSNAIHGLVRWANWAAADVGTDRVTMRHRLHPRAGWPFTLDLSIAYQLENAGLSVTTTATNLGATRCPYGTGAHPYLRLDTANIDELELLSPGSLWMPTDDQGIPTGTEAVEGSDYDFTQRRQIGGTILDTGYADLRRGDDGTARVELADPSTGKGVQLWMDRAYTYLMLFSGDSLADPARRRTGLGVEPMTCAPNALQSGEGLAILEPGETHVGRWGITPTIGR